jgi:solute carrier family 13 (sodium-dependent dicarboxylate transporter), member 2/3/5
MTIWMISWWISEALPIYVTALVPLVIFPAFNVISLGETAAKYADRIIFLFLGGFMLAKAVEKSGLHKRFALTILRRFGTNPRNIVAAFIIVTGFISAWMSNTATAMLMIPIAAAVIAQVHDEQKRSRFAVCLMLSVAYAASLGGMATLIGTPPNAVFASLSKSIQDVDVSFSQWMLVGMPISAVSLFVLWVYMVNVGAKIDSSPLTEERHLVVRKLLELGRMTRDEKLVAVVFAATAAAWVTRGLLWKDFFPLVDDSMIAIMAAIVLFIIPSYKGREQSAGKIPMEMRDHGNSGHDAADRLMTDPSRQENSFAILDWKTAATIPWGVLLLIGGGLALASGFSATGLDEHVTKNLAFLGGTNYVVVILVILVIVAVTIFAGEVISNTATAALIIPIAATLASSLSINPMLLMVPVAVATSYGFMMPVGTPPNAIAFATGHVTVPKMARAGVLLDLIGVAVVTVMTALLVPLVWGN